MENFKEAHTDNERISENIKAATVKFIADQNVLLQPALRMVQDQISSALEDAVLLAHGENRSMVGRVASLAVNQFEAAGDREIWFTIGGYDTDDNQLGTITVRILGTGGALVERER